MTYRKWFETHAEKHRAIVQKLLQAGYDNNQIIDYFDFDNMVGNEPDFCPLYADGKKCHDMPGLNCYFCACPYFRFDDNPETDTDGKKRFSSCAVDAKDGGIFEHDGCIHQDCSNCLVPHRSSVINKQFDTDWQKVMEACPKKD